MTKRASGPVLRRKSPEVASTSFAKKRVSFNFENQIAKLEKIITLPEKGPYDMHVFVKTKTLAMNSEMSGSQAGSHMKSKAQTNKIISVKEITLDQEESSDYD